MAGKKIAVQYTTLTFCIAYLVSGILIVLGQFGYRDYGWVDSIQKFAMKVPFSVYILSPAIASYIVLKKNGRVSGLRQWLTAVFCPKNKRSVYLTVAGGLVLYFGMHMAASGHVETALPFYAFFLSIPGNLIIGGMEESGWMYVLQPELDKKCGFLSASVLVGIIWVLWHIPLFLIPGTSHHEGLIDFWMFNMQVMSLSLFRGAIYQISGKNHTFPFVLFHTLFNAAFPILAPTTTTWKGTIAANTAIILLSISVVAINNKKAY